MSRGSGSPENSGPNQIPGIQPVQIPALHPRNQSVAIRGADSK